MKPSNHTSTVLQHCKLPKKSEWRRDFLSCENDVAAGDISHKKSLLSYKCYVGMTVLQGTLGTKMACV